MIKKDYNLLPLNRVTAICNNNQNEILFISNHEARDTKKLSLPGDFIEFGELAEDALRRSIFQQTTLCVEPIDILGIYSNINIKSAVHIIESVFVCIITNFPDLEKKIGSDKFVWMNRNQIEETKNSISNVKIIEDYYSWRIHKSTFWHTKI